MMLRQGVKHICKDVPTCVHKFRNAEVTSADLCFQLATLAARSSQFSMLYTIQNTLSLFSQNMSKAQDTWQRATPGPPESQVLSL